MVRSNPRLSARELRAMLPRIFAALAAADSITLGHLHKVKIRHKADGSEVTVDARDGAIVLSVGRPRTGKAAA